MPIRRRLTVLLLLILLAPSGWGADQSEREALRFNDAVTKLMSARDETMANQRTKAIAALTSIAKSRAKADDAAGTTEAWRAVLSLDREHVDAREYFTRQKTLDAVLAELDKKPTDLLGLDSGEAPGKTDKKSDQGTVEKKP